VPRGANRHKSAPGGSGPRSAVGQTKGRFGIGPLGFGGRAAGSDRGVFREVWVDTNDASRCVLRNSSHAVAGHDIIVTTRGEWLWTQWEFANCAIG
jgi:hypothetical protein